MFCQKINCSDFLQVFQALVDKIIGRITSKNNLLMDSAVEDH